MIENKICAYCRVRLNKIENDPACRSVEHMIPNVAINRNRKNDEGDFCICRRCNGEKSDIDNIIGKSAKIQGNDEELALEILKKEKERNTKYFKSLKKSAETTPVDQEVTIPLSGKDVVDYMTYLGKGQFLKDTAEVYDPEKYVMKLEWFNKLVMAELEKHYTKSNNRNPFMDLIKNIMAEPINTGECIIHAKDGTYLFFFHNYILIAINILKKSRKNKRIANESRIKILKGFR